MEITVTMPAALLGFARMKGVDAEDFAQSLLDELARDAAARLIEGESARSACSDGERVAHRQLN